MIALIDTHVTSELVRDARREDRAVVERAVMSRVLWCPAVVPVLQETIGRPAHYARDIQKAIDLTRRLARGRVMLEWPDRLRAESLGCELSVLSVLFATEDSEVLWRGLVQFATDDDVVATVAKTRREDEDAAARLRAKDEIARRDERAERLREADFPQAVRDYVGSEAMIETVGGIVRHHGWSDWPWTRRPHECPSLRDYDLHWFARMNYRVIQKDKPRTLTGSYRTDRDLFCASSYADVVVTKDAELADLINLARPCPKGAWSLDRLIQWARAATGA